VRLLYRKRHEVEEVIKVLKSQLSLEACQGGYTRSWKAILPPKEGEQSHPIALCLVAYVLVERERLDQGCTWRQLKRRLILQGRQLLATGLLRRHQDHHLRKRERQETEILPEPAPRRQGRGRRVRNGLLMGAAARGVAQEEDEKQGVDEQDIFYCMVLFLGIVNLLKIAPRHLSLEEM
jgi:hypothetical protein